MNKGGSIWGQAVLLIALAVLPAIGEAVYFKNKISWKSAIPESELVTVETAKSWGDTAMWIDARPDEDFAREHVPSAISLNEDRWNELLPEFLQVWSPEKKIVVYCSAKSCNAAREVAERLHKDAQLPNDIRVLQGGWEEWKKKNR